MGDKLYIDSNVGDMVDVIVAEDEESISYMILTQIKKPRGKKKIREVKLMDEAGRTYTMMMELGEYFSVTPGYDDASLRGYNSGEEEEYLKQERKRPTIDSELVGFGSMASKQDVLAKFEAFADPRVAEISTLSASGRKTRARFYRVTT